MTVGMIIFLAIPDKLLSLFSASEDMLKIGIPALRIICLSFPVASFCIIMSSVFQALGNGIYSMIVSIARQLLALIPSAYILARISGFNIEHISYVWFSYDIAEVVSITISLILFKKMYDEKLKNL